MNRFTKLLALSTCAVAASLLVAACGGGDATPPPSATVINAPSTAPAPDRTAPTVAIFDDVSAATATGPVIFSFVFSEDVGASFTASDVVITGGSAGTFSKVSATQATLLVTPIANSAGTINVSVGIGTFSDIAGNTNTAGATAQQAYNSVVKTQMALPLTFDSTSVNYGFIGFGGAEDSSIVADPANAANQVVKVVRAAGAEVFAGTTITNTAAPQLGLSPKIPFNTTDTRISVRVFSPDVGIPVRLKVEDHADGGKSVEAEVSTTAAGAWQTLIFDFAAGKQVNGTAAINLSNTYDKPTIFFDFGRAKSAAVQKTYYFDDVTFVPGVAPGANAPTVAATTPPARAAADVLSVYSDAYTPIANVNLFPDWGQSTKVSEVLVAGNKTQKYVTLNYEGIDWAATPINVSAMSKLHVDLWTADVTSVKVSIISAGQENAVTVTPTLGAWSSFDIDLAQYTAPNKAAIIQIKIEGAPTGTLYLDNIYFWKAAVSGGTNTVLMTFDESPAPKLTEFGVNGAPPGIVADPAGGTNKVLKFFKFKLPAPGSEQWAGVTVSTGVNNSIPKIPFSTTNKTMTLRVYSPAVGVRVRLKVEDAADGAISVETDALSTVANAWETLTFNFANPGTNPPVGGGATAPLDLTKNYTKASIFFDFGVGNGGSGALPADRIYYADDLTFVGAAAGSGGGCGTAAPTCAPTTVIPAGSTVIYSDASSIAGIIKNPDWGQSPAVVFSEPTIAGNKSLKYTFGGSALYEGIDWAGTPQTVSTKGNLHLDFFSPDITSVKVSIISPGKENFVTKTVTPGSWNAIDIDMALFTVPDKSAIIQIKLEPNVAGTLYVDNIYFSGTAAAGGAGSCAASVAMGAGGAQAVVLSTGDSKGHFVNGEGIFAADYKGSRDQLGNFASYIGGRSDGAAGCGDVGYFNDTTLSNSGQKLDEGGWIAGTSLDPGGTPNFFRYFVLLKPEATFAASYIGLFANAPNNGTLNVSAFSSIKFRLWGPAEMYQQSNLNPVLEMVLSGPKVAGCTATGSGGTEIARNVTANQKIGAGSVYKVGLAAFTVKGVCGTDTAATAVASVLSKLSRVAFTAPASSFNFINGNPGTPVSYSSGINLGPIGFTNN